MTDHYREALHALANYTDGLCTREDRMEDLTAATAHALLAHQPALERIAAALERLAEPPALVINPSAELAGPGVVVVEPGRDDQLDAMREALGALHRHRPIERKE